jgi:hypothetical protein
MNEDCGNVIELLAGLCYYLNHMIPFKGWISIQSCP